MVPGFLSKQNGMFDEIRGNRIRRAKETESYQGTALLSFTGLLSGWSGGMIVWPFVAVVSRLVSG